MNKYKMIHSIFGREHVPSYECVFQLMYRNKITGYQGLLYDICKVVYQYETFEAAIFAANNLEPEIYEQNDILVVTSFKVWNEDIEGYEYLICNLVVIESSNKIRLDKQMQKLYNKTWRNK